MRTHRIELANDLHEKLWELQEKGIDVNSLLLELLQKREAEIAAEKENLAAREIAKGTVASNAGVSRYISKAIKNILQKEHGTKCSIPGCAHDARTIHHTQRFALSRSHDPRFLAPLCREHHVLAHLADVKYAQKLRPRSG